MASRAEVSCVRSLGRQRATIALAPCFEVSSLRELTDTTRFGGGGGPGWSLWPEHRTRRPMKSQCFLCDEGCPLVLQAQFCLFPVVRPLRMLLISSLNLCSCPNDPIEKNKNKGGKTPCKEKPKEPVHPSLGCSIKVNQLESIKNSADLACKSYLSCLSSLSVALKLPLHNTHLYMYICVHAHTYTLLSIYLYICLYTHNISQQQA